MQVYLVGGAVRDEQLGIPVTERDWCVVGATPQQMLDDGYKQVGQDFPVFLHPQSGEEYALARTERKTAPGYHGFDFDTSPGVSIEDDLGRRDLTINALARDSDGQTRLAACATSSRSCCVTFRPRLPKTRSASCAWPSLRRALHTWGFELRHKPAA